MENTILKELDVSNLSFSSNQVRENVIAGYNSIENDILNDCYVNSAADVERVYDRIDSALARWACITSRSQRKFQNTYETCVYANLTTFQPVFEDMRSKLTPDRSNKTISAFSQRSRARLMQKFRKMKKDDLSLPQFVTLTFHENYMKFDRAKEFLNTFLQRFRRKDRTAYYITNPETGRQNKKWKPDQNFRYAWKMEPQQRGAIHFHLMFFDFEKIYPAAWLNCDNFTAAEIRKNKLEYLRLYISTAWNEINQIDNWIPEKWRKNQHSADYFGRLKLRSMEPAADDSDDDKPDCEQLYSYDNLRYGTQVEPTYNWRMAAGYLSKYLGKDADSCVWNDLQYNSVKRGDIHRVEGSPAIRAQWTDKITGRRRNEVKEPAGLDIGRFWGFSNNFDFEAYYRDCKSFEQIDEVKSQLKEIVNAGYSAFLQHCKKRVKEINAADWYKTKERKQAAKNKLAVQLENQMKRARLQIKKIERGAMVQVEISHKETRKILPENEANQPHNSYNFILSDKEKKRLFEKKTPPIIKKDSLKVFTKVMKKQNDLFL